MRLNIIGESINDSVPSTHALFEADDRQGIQQLAREQDEAGAAYIDVNIGLRSAELMRSLVETLHAATQKPFSIDSPDPVLAEAGLAACDPARAVPILNSISALRLNMFALRKKYRFRPILLISEGLFDGTSRACRTAEETCQTARFMLAEAKKAGIEPCDCFLDPGIAPIAGDVEGNLKRLLTAMELIQNDPEFEGVHFSVGLSNFSVMLPAKRKDGSSIKSDLESAFLTLAMPLGLDYAITSVKRKHRFLESDHPAMQCLNDCLERTGFDSVVRVREYYKG